MEKGTKYFFLGAAVLGILLGATKGKKLTKFVLSKEQEYFIKDLHAKAQPIFRKFIAEIEKRGYNVLLTSGFRSFAHQARLKKENTKNASAGTSLHNYGFAIDLNLNKGIRLWQKED